MVRVLDLFCGMGGLSLGIALAVCLGKALDIPVKEPPREEDWSLPYFRRAFADYFSEVGENGC
jgi:hypothetical protein